MFDDRIAILGEPLRIAVDREHPDLMAVAGLFHLAVD